MSIKRHIDFVIYEGRNDKIYFRFYPRQSHCHSFGDEPPKSWNEVYKTYYSYAVLKKYASMANPITLFKENCDECSIISEIAARIKHIANGETFVDVKTPYGDEYRVELLDTEVRPMGMGTSWKISEDNIGYEISMFDYSDKGYRFFLEKEQLKEFGEFLEECCEYMLEHGEPI